MTWTLNLAGPITECYASLDEKVKRAKENKLLREQQDIDAAALLFKQIVPNDPRLRCDFFATGHRYAATDVSFNTTCRVEFK